MSNELPKGVLLLLLDEEQSIEIESALKTAGLQVSVARESHMALELMHKENPQFIIMNTAIEAIDDKALRRAIRSAMNMPATHIITLSDHHYRRHRPQQALEIEADVDLRKPFAMEDLLGALALLESKHPVRMPRKVLTAGSIELVPEEWLVYVDGDPVSLTEKEYRLLQELMEVKGRVLTREALLERVWGHQMAFNVETRTLDVHMSRLRTKLGSSASNIVTVRNVGYRMNLAPEWLTR